MALTSYAADDREPELPSSLYCNLQLFFFLFEKLYRKFAADTGWRETVLAVTATTPKSELVQFLAFFAFAVLARSSCWLLRCLLRRLSIESQLLNLWHVMQTTPLSCGGELKDATPRATSCVAAML